MEGVEILNQYEVVIERSVNWTWFWIPVGILGIVMSVLGLWLWLTGDCQFSIFPIMTIIGILFGAAIGSVAGEVLSIPTKYETRYQVTITDEVKMTEFNERYEILNQEGKIYTVKEK